MGIFMRFFTVPLIVWQYIFTVDVTLHSWNWDWCSLWAFLEWVRWGLIALRNTEQWADSLAGLGLKKHPHSHTVPLHSHRSVLPPHPDENTLSSSRHRFFSHHFFTIVHWHRTLSFLFTPSLIVAPIDNCCLWCGGAVFSFSDSS